MINDDQFLVLEGFQRLKTSQNKQLTMAFWIQIAIAISFLSHSHWDFLFQIWKTHPPRFSQSNKKSCFRVQSLAHGGVMTAKSSGFKKFIHVPGPKKHHQAQRFQKRRPAAGKIGDGEHLQRQVQVQQHNYANVKATNESTQPKVLKPRFFPQGFTSKGVQRTLLLSSIYIYIYGKVNVFHHSICSTSY